MLPENLSTNLTSLNQDQDWAAIVADMVINEDSSLAESAIHRALVHNRAKLAARRWLPWLDLEGPAPPRVQEVQGLGGLFRPSACGIAGPLWPLAAETPSLFKSLLAFSTIRSIESDEIKLRLLSSRSRSGS